MLRVKGVGLIGERVWLRGESGRGRGKGLGGKW